MDTLVTCHVDDGIAIISVDSPPVNVLSTSVRAGIAEHLHACLADGDAKAMVLVCKGRTFFAGADITEMGKPPQQPTLHEVMRTIEFADKPVVAAIHGTALGGGLETALVCHYRISTSTALVGLPEVHLGLLPGGGGTQRLPRLIGIEAALDLMLSGRTISALQANRLGIIDRITEDLKLEHDAVAYAREIVAAGGQLRRIRDFADHLEASRRQPEVFAKFRHENAALMKGYKAPSHIVSAVEAAVSLPFEEGLAREWELFRELEDSPESAAQRHIFFAERDSAKAPDITRETRPAPIKTIALIGPDAKDPGWRKVFEDSSFRVGDFKDWDFFFAENPQPFDLVLETSPMTVSDHQISHWLERDPKPVVIALAEAPSARWEAFAGSWATMLVGLALHDHDATAVEVARGPATSPVVLASIASVLRKLGRIPVITLARKRFVADRLFAAKQKGIGSLIESGANPHVISGNLREFGFSRCAEATGDVLEVISIAPVLREMTREAARIAEEGSVYRATDIDVIAVRAIGWPVYRGGPIYSDRMRNLDIP